ncbi:MAG: DnaD domain protein [Lachnospiraceae bacterium]|nr:DnaD domain protein [Lachnospiraceae bacterium]
MKIYTDTSEGSTVVQNSFIDQYMPHANGEFVKVYLYLLRCADSGRELSLSSIADVFEHTEKDVRRALTYWERQRLLRIGNGPDGELVSVTFTDPGYYSTHTDQEGEMEGATGLYSDGISSYQERPLQNIRTHREQKPDPNDAEATRPEAASGVGTAIGTGVSGDGRKNASGRNTSGEKREEQDMDKELTESGEEIPLPGSLSEKAQTDLKELFFVAEQYLGRPLSATEQNDFVYYYHTLGFSADLIEYLLEYCITKNATSRHYMRKVAQGWARSGIKTVQEAKKESGRYNKDYYTIMKAFGIKNRAPAPSEQETMARWLHEYGFSMDLILEACRRTIDQIHEPNFQYADKILTQWLDTGIQSMKDVGEADRKWEQEQAAKKVSQGRPRTGQPNRFNNFSQRSYNYEKLERRLFGQS